jgi:NAD(P)-dependent dehydrogenase (short-subunit alcohol dehydrogenase family)
MASIYRAGVWFLHGWWNYGKAGYERASKKFDLMDLEVNLNDQIAIVTGSNSGLGLETSYELARRGAKVYMLCRNVDKGLAAIKELKARPCENGNLSDRLILKKVDVSIQADINDFVNNFEEDHVDILINNAGCMIDGRPLTSEGIELNFATNVIGPYLLTEKLIPKLSKAKEGKRSIVLTVTSGGMLTQKLEPSDIQLSKITKGLDIYPQNKVNTI